MGEGHSNTTGHGARGPTGGVKGGGGRARWTKL